MSKSLLFSITKICSAAHWVLRRKNMVKTYKSSEKATAIAEFLLKEEKYEV